MIPPRPQPPRPQPPRPQPPSPRRAIRPGCNARRGFTLLEVMLAAVLGFAIISAALALFGSLQRTEVVTRRQGEGVMTLARVHDIATRTLGRLVVNPANPRATNRSVRNRPIVPTTPPAPAAGHDKRPPTPRLVLEPDPQTGLQRLEVVVAEPPLLGGADGRTARLPPAEMLAVVRGALVLRPARDGNPEELELWWDHFGPENPRETPPAAAPAAPPATPPPPRETPPAAPAPDPASTDDLLPAPSRTPVDSLLIASGLRNVRWRFARTDETEGKLTELSTISVAALDEMPAYALLDIETIDGQRARWMFELVWSVVADKTLADAFAVNFGPAGDPAADLLAGDPASPTDPGDGTPGPVAGAGPRPAPGSGSGDGLSGGDGDRWPDGSPMDPTDRSARARYLQELERLRREDSRTRPR